MMTGKMRGEQTWLVFFESRDGLNTRTWLPKTPEQATESIQAAWKMEQDDFKRFGETGGLISAPL